MPGPSVTDRHALGDIVQEEIVENYNAMHVRVLVLCIARVMGDALLYSLDDCVMIMGWEDKHVRMIQITAEE